ncbi:hypothetical protein GTR02_16760 [Kineococcus sp. R8]|uniref:hypothetical protein n=1 Tax=Kineococcus siccus TaxID=2696567 RepID=UPI001411CD80|nr:hypothetical protein [Kineococcus siccus]NAZ83469.1 hypothetical protein [Kineococcus siccus]
MSITKRTWYAWALGSLAVFAVLETEAVLNERAGDTFSANWWRLRTHLPARLLVFPPLAWALYHLFVPTDRETGGADDAAVVAGGALLAVLARYRPRTGD